MAVGLQVPKSGPTQDPSMFNGHQDHRDIDVALYARRWNSFLLFLNFGVW
jgi:hypothetical protein